jgi:pyruvate,water dikinase
MTDPDWVPIMKRAAAIVTDQGGRTSHAAIVSRELGIPAIVGTENATKTLKQDQAVTVSCAEGDKGHVYEGKLQFETKDLNLEDVPETKTQIMLNIGTPQAAMRWWKLPCKGVGLARMEYLINNVIKIHPLALTRFDKVEDKDARDKIEKLTWEYEDKTEYFVALLARGIAVIAASRYPHQVIVRMSDFKTNEYADLIGGRQFEPAEENPMLGWRGASRYYSADYQDGFALECRAIRRVREKMGFANVTIMIPFCRTPAEADQVLAVLDKNGLKRGEQDLQVFIMAEIPTNILEAAAFAERFDGFSIGSNDLTQLTVGIGRDSEKLAPLFDESQASVKRLIRMLIDSAHKAGRKVGICGEAPSNNTEFAAFLVEAGIDSISLQPDSVLQVIRRVAEMEQN